MTTQENAFCDRVRLYNLSLAQIIGSQRKEHTDVLRILSQHLLIDSQSFFRLVVHDQSLAIHGLIVQVIGVLFGQGRHLCHRLFLFAQTVVESNLRH